VSNHDTMSSCFHMHQLVLGGISFLLPAYGITNSEQCSVFYGITVFDQAKLHKVNYIGKHFLCT